MKRNERKKQRKEIGTQWECDSQAGASTFWLHLTLTIMKYHRKSGDRMNTQQNKVNNNHITKVYESEWERKKTNTPHRRNSVWLT